MMTELLKAYQRHTQTLINLLNESKDLASSDYDCDALLSIARDGLNHIVTEVQPDNVLAKAMIQDSSSIECHIDQSEFLINAASAVLNVINAEFDALNTESLEAIRQ